VETYSDCIPCLIRQAVDAARLATEDESLRQQILRDTLVATSQMDFSQPPPVMAQFVHRQIRELTGNGDSYRVLKDRQNAAAWKLYDRYHPTVGAGIDGLEGAVRLAIAGNVIDLGAKSGLDESEIEAVIANCLTEPLDGEIRQFADAVAAAKRILYLTDNAGEIVLDRLLLEKLPCHKVTLAVRGKPVINDATQRDAETARLGELVAVIDNGSDAPGTLLDDCSEQFRQQFREADLIIAKGQGNYETLCRVPGPIFFLLRVKCPVLARDLECPVGRMVLRGPSGLRQ